MNVARSRDAVTAGSFWRTLPAAALRGLAKGAAPARVLLLVQALEARLGHVDLAAHLDSATVTASSVDTPRLGAQPQRHVADRSGCWR